MKSQNAIEVGWLARSYWTTESHPVIHVVAKVVPVDTFAADKLYPVPLQPSASLDTES